MVAAGERAAWAVLALAVASWTIGDALWDFVYGGLPPFPSWCDAFYLGFYPPAYVGLALLVGTRLSRFERSVWLDGVMVALAVASRRRGGAARRRAHQTQGKLLADATNLAYPLGDIVLLALLAGVFGLTGWRPGLDWLLIGAALALTALADALYLYRSAVGTYVSGTFLDTLWPASLLLLGIAAWLPTARRGRLQLLGRPLAATPVACGAVALAVLLDSYVQRRNAVGVGLAAATVAMVVARTVLTFRENAREHARAQMLALTDALTGLWNRRRLLVDLDGLLEQPLDAQAPERLLILYDLNGFKGYNDTFGHPAGDLLLRRLAEKLVHAAGQDATCYRLGGDEFCVLAPYTADAAEACLAATTIALSEAGEGFTVSTAFGCAILPEEARNPSDALHLADRRLYANKHRFHTRNGQPHRALVQALYEREPGIEDHISSVTELAVLVGRRLDLSLQELEELELAAQLHDIGKLAIPDAILDKPGPLDAAEQALVHQHTIVGERILNASPAFSKIAATVRASHERWDGTGYPDQLGGDQIPLAARIIAVCDAYSAMTSVRPYRRALSSKEALAELHRCAGGQFDPAVAMALRQVLGSVRAGTGQRLES